LPEVAFESLDNLHHEISDFFLPGKAENMSDQLIGQWHTGGEQKACAASCFHQQTDQDAG
jgi:hypothetical protein